MQRMKAGPWQLTQKKYELEIPRLGAYIGVNDVYVHNIEEELLLT